MPERPYGHRSRSPLVSASLLFWRLSPFTSTIVIRQSIASDLLPFSTFAILVKYMAELLNLATANSCRRLLSVEPSVVFSTNPSFVLLLVAWSDGGR